MKSRAVPLRRKRTKEAFLIIVTAHERRFTRLLYLSVLPLTVIFC